MIVTIDEVDIIVADDAVNNTGLLEGELYVAKRNRPWQMLTCRFVDVLHGYVVPMELAYPFNTGECHKVIGVAD